MSDSAVKERTCIGAGWRAVLYDFVVIDRGASAVEIESAAVLLSSWCVLS
jgi:hypothetical protein